MWWDNCGSPSSSLPVEPEKGEKGEEGEEGQEGEEGETKWVEYTY